MIHSLTPSLLFRHSCLLAIIGLTVLIAFSSCDTSITGSKKENQPPKTNFTVDRIDVPEDIRFASRVDISWWGTDPDGYIVGYEWSISEPGEEDWQFTERNDSTFLLPIPEGEKTADVRFTIRAIDNDGAHDPDPPYLVFPIENSAPTIEWSSTVSPPDTTFQFLSLGWDADDPDGEDDLSHVELAANDSSGVWTEIPADIDFVSLEIKDSQTETTEADVFVGRSFSISDKTVPNINLNGDNKFYVRSVDHAGERSSIDSLQVFIKEQTSRVLVLNDDGSQEADQRLGFHIDLLNTLGIDQVDIIEITDGETQQGQKVPVSSHLHAPIDPTLNRIFAEWDYIYWFSNNMDRHIVYGREFLESFLSQGGKLFANIPTKNLPDGDPAFDILPVERLERVPSGASSFVIWGDQDVTPYPGKESELPNMLLQRTQTSVIPIIAPGGSTNLYEAPFETRPPSDYDGSKVISSIDPENQIVFFGINLWDFRDDSESVESFLDHAINDILEFQN